MGNNSFPSHLSASLLVLILFISSGGIPCPVKAQAPEQGSWCIPRPSASEEALVANINYACGTLLLDCSIIQEGGACYYPTNLMIHASVAMNLYYQKVGRNYWNCDFSKTAVIAVTDPSFGDCLYEYTPS